MGSRVVYVCVSTSDRWVHLQVHLVTRSGLWVSSSITHHRSFVFVFVELKSGCEPGSFWFHWLLASLQVHLPSLPQHWGDQHAPTPRFTSVLVIWAQTLTLALQVLHWLRHLPKSLKIPFWYPFPIMEWRLYLESSITHKAKWQKQPKYSSVDVLIKKVIIYTQWNIFGHRMEYWICLKTCWMQEKSSFYKLPHLWFFTWNL